MAIRVNGQNVRLAEPSAQDIFEIEGAATAEYRLTELDQTDPAGRYRWIATGDQAIFQRAATAAWATATTFLTIDGATSVIQLAQAVRVNDDLRLALGTDLDDVLYHRSTALGANTALTGVLVGTPLVQDLDPDSLIISNVTASGDFALALNRGGNSESYLHIDSSAGELRLDGRGAGNVRLRTANITRLVVGSDGQINHGLNTVDALSVFSMVLSLSGAGFVRGLLVDVNLSPTANNSASVARIIGTLNEAGSGTHPLFAGLSIVAPTIVAGLADITDAVSLYIADAPTAGVNNYALWVDAGAVRLDATTANGIVATAMSSLGPTGSNTTIQEWLTININGTVRYIPCF